MVMSLKHLLLSESQHCRLWRKILVDDYTFLRLKLLSWDIYRSGNFLYKFFNQCIQLVKLTNICKNRISFLKRMFHLVFSWGFRNSPPSTGCSLNTATFTSLCPASIFIFPHKLHFFLLSFIYIYFHICNTLHSVIHEACNDILLLM